MILLHHLNSSFENLCHFLYNFYDFFQGLVVKVYVATTFVNYYSVSSFIVLLFPVRVFSLQRTLPTFIKSLVKRSLSYFMLFFLKGFDGIISFIFMFVFDISFSALFVNFSAVWSSFFHLIGFLCLCVTVLVIHVFLSVCSSYALLWCDTFFFEFVCLIMSANHEL